MRVIRGILGALSGYLIFCAHRRGAWRAQWPQHACLATAVVRRTHGRIRVCSSPGLVASWHPESHRTVVGRWSACLACWRSGATASLVSSPAADARWSQWTALLLMAPSAYLVPRLLGRARA